MTEEARIFERHLLPDELAEAWGLSTRTIIRLFQDEPGVLKNWEELQGTKARLCHAADTSFRRGARVAGEVGRVAGSESDAKESFVTAGVSPGRNLSSRRRSSWNDSKRSRDSAQLSVVAFERS